jgi:hypothetical protein
VESATRHTLLRSIAGRTISASFLVRPRARAAVATLFDMTRLPAPRDLPPLLTDDDIRRRIETLIAPALRDGTLWLFFLDGDHRQAPVVMPIEDMPHLPDDLVNALGDVLTGFLPELGTEMGPGSVVLIRERLGPDDVLPDDLVWADALVTMCRTHDVILRGIYLVTPTGTRGLS